MYGHKQILQCLFVVFLVTVLNFYRSAIRRDREIQEYRIERISKNDKPTPEEAIKVDLPIVHDDKPIDTFNQINNNIMDNNKQICETQSINSHEMIHSLFDEYQCNAFNQTIDYEQLNKNQQKK